MTRDEYLMTLKGGLSSLSEEEQNEAIKYYSDYFEEINDDVKVFAELGSPDDVATLTVEHYKASEDNQKKIEEENSDETEAEFNEDKSADYRSDESGYNSFKSEKKRQSSSKASNALFYRFDNVNNLDFNFGAAEVVAIKGSCFSVETRGIDKNSLNCFVNSSGTLIVHNRKRINLNWFNHDRSSSVIPKILLTVPDGSNFGSVRINVDAGTFYSEEAGFSFAKGKIDVGAGSIVVHKINGKNLSLRCGMGSVNLEGKLEETTNIDCGMGSVKLTLKGNAQDYSLDSKVGLGEVKFNDEKKSGVGQSYAEIKKENHFSVNCGMGTVNISVHRF